MARRKRTLGNPLDDLDLNADLSPTWDMSDWHNYSTQLRYHCPACGMMANIERLDDAPYAVDVWLQRFGGGRNRMAYDEIQDPDLRADVLRTLLDLLPAIDAYLRSELGEEEEEESADFEPSEEESAEPSGTRIRIEPPGPWEHEEPVGFFDDEDEDDEDEEE